MQRRLIIARYLENLKLTEKINDEIIIYNSGDIEKASPHADKRQNGGRMRFLNSSRHPFQTRSIGKFEYNPSAILINGVPNIGKETGKWLEYLINYYGNYADINIFLQAYPFDHITFNSLLTIPITEHFGYIKNLNGRLHDNQFENKKWLVNPHGYDQAHIYKIIYEDFMPDRYDWYVGGQFFITRDLLMKNKLSYYERLKDILIEFEEDGPYCFERSWLTFLLRPPEQYLA